MPQFPAVTFRKPNAGRIDWDVAGFRRALLQKGQPARWEMAAMCPCRQRVVTEQSDIDADLGYGRADCPECSGTGTLYHSEQTITVLAAAMDRNAKHYAPFGVDINGGCAFTTLPEQRPAFLDRLTLTQSTMVYSEVRVRTRDLERTRYPIVERTVEVGSDADPTVPEARSFGVLYVRAADREGRVAGSELVEGTDFEMENGAIRWLSNNAPQVGSTYTISYNSNPVYVVRNLNFAARNTFVKAKRVSPEFVENVVSATMAWLEVLGRPGWPTG